MCKSTSPIQIITDWSLLAPRAVTIWYLRLAMFRKYRTSAAPFSDVFTDIVIERTWHITSSKNTKIQLTDMHGCHC